MKLHALVDDLETAQAALVGGATVLQLRLKDVPTRDVIERGRPFRDVAAEAGCTFVVNDDVEAAIALRANGVHLGRDDRGHDQALANGLMLGLSASSVAEAIEAERLGADYVGAGPVWGTPSKPDADPPIGPAGLAAICEAVSLPVVAIGGIDGSNAAACVEAGAAGVAVVRAAADSASILAVLARAGL
ncbi:MAG: thiamine phosphate synthase [Gaiellaceae bacterium]